MVIASEIPHLDIRDWLHRLELVEYGDNFKKYSEVKELIDFNESDIKELGVKNSAHRARMVASLVALKGKEFKIEKKNFSFLNPNGSRKFKRSNIWQPLKIRL